MSGSHLLPCPPQCFTPTRACLLRGLHQCLRITQHRTHPASPHKPFNHHTGHAEAPERQGWRGAEHSQSHSWLGSKDPVLQCVLPYQRTCPFKPALREWLWSCEHTQSLSTKPSSKPCPDPVALRQQVGSPHSAVGTWEPRATSFPGGR